MISDTPAAVGTFSFTVKATNGVSPDATKALSIKIVADSGTGGGSSSGGSPAPAAPTPETTISGGTATTTITAKTSTDGKAQVSVTQSQISNAVKKAAEAAARSGEPSRVQIQVKADSNISALETTPAKAALLELVTGKMDSLTLSSSMPTATFDAQAIAAIADAASDSVIFTASKVDAASLSDAARQLVDKKESGSEKPSPIRSFLFGRNVDQS